MISILHLSDTHSRHRRLTRLPDADILVHSGDFTMNGNEQEAIDFMNWFCGLPYPHKIFICGNHDCLFRKKAFDEIKAKFSRFSELMCKTRSTQTVCLRIVYAKARKKELRNSQLLDFLRGQPGLEPGTSRL